ncbi:MAG: Cof-type HAD-IIB family hydrolase [Thermoanaerobacterales bacterium]|nr:Cof-type HAD-IIB family hydrolase [Thermoanaerobacterales bacterium]
MESEVWPLHYRLLAVDLDDTLLDSAFRVSPRNREALRGARERGVIVTLATGRMYASAARIARELGIDVPLITYQGALVRKASGGPALLHRTVPLDAARALVGALRAGGLHVNVYLRDRLYMAELTPVGARYAAISGVEAHPVGDLLALLEGGEEPTKVLAIAEEEVLDGVMAEMLPVYGSAVHITKSKPHFLEFSHPRATKGAALAWLAERYGVPREAVVAVGDSYNDLDMVEFAGLGVIMGNARAEVKERADFVAPPNDRDGVAEVIERFILEEGG